ncbi:hypothetical protein ACFLX5_02325, partial [Chloroflexota bacterium]
MASVCFVGPYKPIVCGIADYTSYIVRGSQAAECGVISFDPQRYGDPLANHGTLDSRRVWYGIADRRQFSASSILEGLGRLGLDGRDAVLWFQHEFGIWPDNDRFIAMLAGLEMPKMITFHTVHFQSSETPSGLRRTQYEMLHSVLPHVDAISVFSYGAYRAVTSAFPEYRGKVNVLRHGVHSYPEVTRLSRGW